MSFYGLDFCYDGKYSGNYGLYIISLNDSVVTDTSAGSNVEILSDFIYRNPRQYDYGVSQNEVLSFDMEIMSPEEQPAIYRSKVEKWLFGRMEPCKLQIMQPDLQNIYFNCRLINPKLQYIGNKCYGFTCTVQCDAPWAWQVERTYSFVSFEEAIRHYNDSDNTDYTYPRLWFKMKPTIMEMGEVSLINETDNNREFRFTGLAANEEITVDCERQIITSSTGLLRSENFNKKFFRLVSGLNVLHIGGEASGLRMTYSNARKVGG